MLKFSRTIYTKLQIKILLRRCVLLLLQMHICEKRRRNQSLTIGDLEIINNQPYFKNLFFMQHVPIIVLYCPQQEKNKSAIKNQANKKQHVLVQSSIYQSTILSSIRHIPHGRMVLMFRLLLFFFFSHFPSSCAFSYSHSLIENDKSTLKTHNSRHTSTKILRQWFSGRHYT